MRRLTLPGLALVLAGAAFAEVRSSSSANYTIEKEVLSGGGGVASVPGTVLFSSFAQPQTGFMQGALSSARLGFLGAKGVPPKRPLNLTASPGNEQVFLDWDDNTETNIAGYYVSRSETEGGPYVKVSAALVATSEHTDTGLTNYTTYYYVVTAVDTGYLESLVSNEASATPRLNAGILGGGCGAGACMALAFLAALALRKRR